MFPPDAAAVYIVFESAPLEDPTQVSAQWFLEGEGGALPAKPFGEDILELPGYERYGFLELKRPGERWPMGRYVVKLYIAPHGQQSFHAVNQVGTLRFTITDKMLSPSPPTRLGREPVPGMPPQMGPRLGLPMAPPPPPG